MSIHTHKIIDGVEIQLTSEEIAELDARDLAWEQEQTRLEAEQQAKENLKASAHEKLAALGLTADEIAAIA